jgi:uncharacterized YccA/Bax inhibitor family protein
MTYYYWLWILRDLIQRWFSWWGQKILGTLPGIFVLLMSLLLLLITCSRMQQRFDKITDDLRGFAPERAVEEWAGQSA